MYSVIVKVTQNATLQQIEGVVNGLNSLLSNITNVVVGRRQLPPRGRPS